ncbi:MAG: transcriptional repressor LexA [Planctomycetales bacterium]|nr:transcriptional repressor LexA [Planctomycetales bacterium]
MADLTSRQQAVYEFVRDKICNRGYGPTVREIGDEFGIRSPNGVMCHLKALERKGLIARSSKRARAIELTEEALTQGRGLPMVGVVAAGLTTLAFEQNERIDFAELFDNSRGDQFVLRVHGDSMIEAQIADGDFVVIRRQKTARAGEMVVAQTDEGEATLKFWFPERGRIRLQPANSNMSPIYVNNAEVLGVVTGVVRQV